MAEVFSVVNDITPTKVFQGLLPLIPVNNQLDALFQCIYFFHFSTCFQQPSAHHQENQLYQYIIWYISLCVGDCWYAGQQGRMMPETC
jgi:hypothetical protein